MRCAGRAAEIAVGPLRTIRKQRFGRKIGSLWEDETASPRRLSTEMYGE